MTKKEFKAKSETLNKILQCSCTNYVFVRNEEDKTTVGMRGTLPELCFMAHRLCESISEEAEKVVGKKGAVILIKKITLTEEEMAAEWSMRKKAEKIPSWLRKLMEIDFDEEEYEEEEDDSTDEADGDEEDDAEEIVSRLEDILKRYHLRGDLDLHLDDDSGE